MKSKIIFVALFFATHFAQAQDWTGAVNSDWNNPANWDGFPANGDNVSVSFANYSGAMAHPVINSNSLFSPAEMLVDGGAVLTVNADLTTTDRVEIIGNGTKLILNAGILNISGGAGNARIIFAEEAQFIMSGGEFNVGQRLLFELGASGQMSDGTIDIVGTFALIDGLGLVSSSFTQSGGFIQTEEFGFENEAGNFHPIYNLEDGIFSVNGAFLVEGAAPGAGLGEFYATDGEANFYGTMGNIAGSTMNYILRFEENSILNVYGPTVDQLPGDSIVITNQGTMNIQSNLVWNNEGVLTGELGEVVVNGNLILNGNGEYQFPYLTVLAGKSLTQTAPELISVNGDFVLAGSYNQLNHALQFNGGLQQDFSLVQDLVLDALIFNNAGEGVTVSHNLTISDSCKWLDGVLDLGPNTLTFQDGALSFLASENSYAIGAVVKTGNEAFLFPVGSVGNRYRPLEISAPISVSTVIKVEYFSEPYASTTPIDAPLQTVSSLEYWNVERTGSTDFVTINTGWNNANASGLVDCASISLAHWDNASWGMIPSVASGLCNGSGSGSLQSTAEIEEFGIYTIGFTEGVYQYAFTVCAGETVTVGVNTYDTSGVYFDLFTDVNGDDSLVVTALTVLPELNLTVQENQTYLVANAENANYQWLDCGNGFLEIAGAQSQTFSPSQNGTYAVVIESNGCSDTSACYAVTHLSVSEFGADLILYPNPVNANGKINVTTNIGIVSAEWMALDGTILPCDFMTEKIISTPRESGFYMLLLQMENGMRVTRKMTIIN